MRFLKNIILIILICISVQIQAFDVSNIRFHSVSAVNYHAGIQGIVKDRLGRIWYNGRDVLFMYDGYSSRQLNDLIIKNEPYEHWVLEQLFADKEKNIYVITNRGLLLFDYNRFSFDFVLRGNIRSVTYDNNNVIWAVKDDDIVSFSVHDAANLKYYRLPADQIPSYITCVNNDVFFTVEGKIYTLNKKNGASKLLTAIDEPKIKIQRIIEHNDILYVLTYQNGLYILNRDGKQLKHLNIPSESEKSVIAKEIYLDESQTIWIGTQSGLFLYNINTDQTALLQSDLNNIYSLPQNSIWSMYPDPDGGIWVGTFGGQMAYYSSMDNEVKYISASKGQLNNSIVSCFEEDNNGNIWIGTEGGGLNFWDRKKNTFSYYEKNNKEKGNIRLVKTLHFDQSKRFLQISAFNGGISRYDTQSGTFTDVGILNPYNKSHQLNVYDYTIIGDSAIWIADPDEKLFYKNLKTGKVTPVELSDDSGNILNLNIECMLYNGNDYLWLFTHDGLYVMDISKHGIVKKYYITGVPFAVNNLLSYYKASDSNIWIGTFGGGLNLLKKDGTYVNYNADNGFTAKIVFGILEDDKTQNIWFSTDNGLYYWHKESDSFHKAEFLTNNLCGSFYARACYKTSTGEMLFGGTKGFIVFNPSHIRRNTFKPKVYLTDLIINNKWVTPSTDHSPINKDISVLSITSNTEKEIEEIVLSHKQSNIEIRFASNSYLYVGKNRYSYRMVGLSKEWQELPEGRNSIQFFDLKAGSYILELRAANNDGVWGDETTSLHIKVKPSPFLTSWAYLVYISLILWAVYMVWRYFTNKKIFKHRLELERIKEQNLQELTQTKINFFTNISHDLKTPLTLVINPLNRLKEALPNDHTINSYLFLIEKNVVRIRRLISQLLLFREIESKNIVVDNQPGYIFKFVSSIFSLFEPFAHQKNINTLVESQIEDIYSEFDHDILEKILSNLFSNAVKYTPEGESISIIVRNSSNDEINDLKNFNKFIEDRLRIITIEICNTGTNIDEDQKELMFKSFSRLSDRRLSSEESTGLGLSIVKELARALSGNVFVSSVDEIVSFKVVLAFSHLNQSVQQEEPVVDEAYNYAISELDAIEVTPLGVLDESKQSRKKNNIVIIEDDPMLCAYMEKELVKYYNVYTANNGRKGIAMVEKVSPQIVITDLMMPEANGFEVCRNLRSNIKTSHIPIIILSALGGNHQNKIKGLKEGADVFIEKPFDINFLIQQLSNIIESRQKLKDIYSKRYVAEPSKVIISSIDEELLDKAMSFIEKNIDNPEYDVEKFTSDMNIGRTLLYQKINEVVGMSIKEFILDVRLKRSAQLLSESEYSIAEIAYMTGFSDPKYFSVCFKKNFGLSPSEFKK